MAELPILIAGGGIGGLTLANALARAGRAFRVLEHASALRPVGAGITVQFNAMAILRELELDHAVREAGQVARSSAILDPRGRVLSTVSLEAIASELGAPAIGLSRARLQAALLAKLAPDVIEGGKLVTGFREEEARVVALLGDGSEVEGALLVGADGLHSRVRAQLLGERPTRYAGYTSWRGISPRADLAPEGKVTETWGPGARFGIVPIGFGEVYWFATLNAPPGGRDAPERIIDDLLKHFGSWHSPIRELIATTAPEKIIRADIYDRPPVTRWCSRRVTLLGDAAHPMTPNLGQGGCQAIEDAVALAEALAGTASIEEALRIYSARRIRRANRFVTQAWSIGRFGQWEHATGLRALLLRLTPARSVQKKIVATLRV